MTTTQEFLKEIKEKDIHTRQDRENYLGQELDKFIIKSKNNTGSFLAISITSHFISLVVI